MSYRSFKTETVSKEEDSIQGKAMNNVKLICRY